MTTATPQVPDPLDAAWIARHFGPVARPRPRTDGSTASLYALAESLRGQLRKRDAELAELRREVGELRNELAVARKLDAIMNRLDRLEQPRGGGLRAV